MTTSESNENVAGRVLRFVIVTCSLLLCAPRLVAQSVPDSGIARVAAPPTELKSGTAATIMSVFLPGLGHAIAPLLCAGPWFYGVIDAHNAAARYNRAHATKTSDANLYPVITPGVNGALRLGIRMHLTR
jgi:hypothetical protein